MAWSKLKTWIREYLTYQDLNAEFDNVYTKLNYLNTERGTILTELNDHQSQINAINTDLSTNKFESDGITAKQATKALNSTLAFGLIYPFSGQSSPWYRFRTPRTLSQIFILCNVVPTSTVTVNLYKNGASVVSFTFTTGTHVYTPTTDKKITFALGDVIYAVVSGGVTNLTALTVELELD